MADDKTFTKADVDAAVADALAKVQESVNKLETKNEELVGELRTTKQELRKSKDINPEDLAKLEDENEKLRTELTKAQKEAKDAAKAAETATKALETEQGAARSYALEAEISSAIASGNVVPSLVPAFKALVMREAKADLVDGKYAVSIGDKPAGDYIKSFLDSDDGKAFRSAPNNSGGGAPGGKGGEGGKTMSREEYKKAIVSDPAGTTAFVKEGGKIVDQAA